MRNLPQHGSVSVDLIWVIVCAVSIGAVAKLVFGYDVTNLFGAAVDGVVDLTRTGVQWLGRRITS